MPIPMPAILAALSIRRPVFHSEADFQHELAWELHSYYQAAGIQLRLELPVIAGGRRMEVDIWAIMGGVRVAIELKYKTKGVNITHAGEVFTLKQHSATPLGRYDFLKDVERLEYIRAAGVADEAWAVMLTNDRSYTGPARGNGAEFSIHRGRIVGPGVQCMWNKATNVGSLGKYRLQPINIAGPHVLAWQPYSAAGGQVFESLIVAM